MRDEPARTTIHSLVLHALLLLAGVVCFASDASAATSDGDAPAVAWAAFAVPLACTPREQCCRVCDVGRACGKSCISESKTCHKGRGCACNVEDVCAR